MMYILENTDKLKDDFLYNAMNLLSLQRLQKIDSLRIQSDKVNSAAVYIMLRYALKKEYSITEKPDFYFKDKGKPYLCEYDNIFFSLSHCRNACACIISEEETACDITDKRKISDNTARYFCTGEEYGAAKASCDKNSTLVELWTKKECYSKLSGAGLSLDFKTITGSALSGINTYENEKYVASYFGSGKPEILSAEQIFEFLR